MDTHALIGNAICRSHAIEKLLKKHYPAAKGSLLAAVRIAADVLPAILIRAIQVVAIVRNSAAHPDRFKPTTVPPDFDRLCNEIELLIPYFASQQHTTSAPSPKRRQPIARNPQATPAIAKPRDSGAATSLPANRGKPWTSEEDKKLVEAFDAQVTIPNLAQAHQRGVGGIRNRLTKLGKLTAEYHPDGLAGTP